MSLNITDLVFFDQASFRNFKKPQKQAQDDVSSAIVIPVIGSQVNSISRQPKSKRHSTAPPFITKSKGDDAEKPERPSSAGIRVNVFVSAYADEIEHMHYFEKLKNAAPLLLTNIDGMILHCKIAGIPFPRGLENILNYSWSDLIKEVSYSRKRWPTAACQYTCEPRKALQKTTQSASLSPDSIETENIKSRSKSTLITEEVKEEVTMRMEREPISINSVKRHFLRAGAKKRSTLINIK
ncbi:uncharacterized protein LOC121286101 [Carcharodon carcharias]|uniref:uncharacterized protein LOC121286101 n=1 Tax=Carcharodon carcharias TaxID=13397 RepID=UPI001B7DE1DB|nr:uncharacterized protein LOC121286101 [Carcharodon carcharias]